MLIPTGCVICTPARVVHSVLAPPVLSAYQGEHVRSEKGVSWQVVELTADSGEATAPPAGIAAAGGDLVGVPALVACRVKLVWEAEAAAAAEVRTAAQTIITLRGHRIHPTLATVSVYAT